MFPAHLKPNGKVALADLDKEDGTFHAEGTEGIYHEGFDRDEMRSILEKNGFRDIKFVTAHTVAGEEKDYPVFLVTATRK